MSSNYDTPESALRKYYNSFTAFELGEIYDYKEIYYTGENAKKIVGNLNAANNNGYDDDTGSYIAVQYDHIAYRYEILKKLGRGSFGQVYKCYDHKNEQYVALKIVKSRKCFQQQANDEIEILSKLKKLDKDDSLNIIHMIDSFTFRNHICITFELLSGNLYQLMKKYQFSGFSLKLIRKFTHSLLICLNALYKNKIIHSDLKPENILLKQAGKIGIKVIDFGSSCYENHCIYSYIQSRFYRAPEVILGLSYGLPIDMWSLGCVIAELITGHPLFPGEDEADQMACMMELLGMPPSRLIKISPRAHHFINSKGYPKYCTVILPDNSIQWQESRSFRFGKVRGLPNSKDWITALKGNDDPLVIDFIKKCLDWNPVTRMTPSQALKHKWIRGNNDFKSAHTSEKISNNYQHASSFHY
jgi:dual specificity tyrosine-phosphorylation-regulated kinase 2/3/4